MILDNEAELTTATGFDLESVRPGPGEPIHLWAAGVGGALVVTTGADATEAEGGLTPLIEVDATEDVEFELPSNAQQFIAATFATGTVNIILEGAQTNT